jgi:hypothetical protein
MDNWGIMSDRSTDSVTQMAELFCVHHGTGAADPPVGDVLIPDAHGHDYTGVRSWARQARQTPLLLACTSASYTKKKATSASRVTSSLRIALFLDLFQPSGDVRSV